MLVTPSDHYALHEEVATTIGEVRSFIDEVHRIAASRSCNVFWRGQSNHKWGITSSLVREASSPTVITDTNLRRAEREMLDEAKAWVTAAPTRLPENDLEWLAFMQHHGIPTRMLDFTPNPLVATFFACETMDDIEGRLIAILAPASMRLSESEVDSFDINDIPVGEVRLWEPGAHVSPRLAAQDGVFIIGRLPSTRPPLLVRDVGADTDKRQMLRTEVVSMMSIPLYLHRLAVTRRNSSSIPSCYTVRIRVDKAAIREQLNLKSKRGGLRPAGGQAIDHAYCYPDIDGMKTYSRALQTIKRSIG